MRSLPWRVFLPVGLWAVGCTSGSGEPPPDDVPTEALASNPVAVAHGPTTLGPGEPLVAWWVNEHGVAVSGGDVEVSVDGEAAAWAVEEDGVARWVPAQPGRYRIEGEGWQSWVFAHDARWDGPGMDPVVDLGEAVVVAATVGDSAVVALEDGRVWRIGGDGRRWPVASLSEPPVLLKAVALDEDGVRDDLVVVSDSLVAWLRREGEVFRWFGGLRSPSGGFRGASVGDLDDDGRLDLLVTRGSALDWFAMREGELTWVRRHRLGGPIFDVGVTRLPESDVATVLTEEGWVRLRFAGGELLDVGPDLPSSVQGDRLLSTGADVYGDGVEEVVLMPRLGRDPLGFVLVASLGPSGDQSMTERSWSDAGVTLADADGDGAADLVGVLGDGEVKRLGWAPGGPREWSLGRLPAGAVVMLGSEEGSLADLVVSRAGLAKIYRGARNEVSPWRPQERRRTLLSSLRPQQVVSWDDGDPQTGSFLAWVERDGRWSLGSHVWEGFPAQTPQRTGETSLREGEEVVSTAVCGTQAWILTDERMMRVALDGPHEVLAERDAVGGRGIACTHAAGETWAAWIGDDGAAWLDDDLVDGDSLALEGFGLAVAPPLESTPAAARSCPLPGCGIAWLGWQEDGPIFVQQPSPGEALERLREGQSAEVLVASPLEAWTVGDVDGDGWPDAVAVDAQGVVWSARSAGGGGLSVQARHRHPFGAWSGSIAVTDVDGDGQAEVVGVEEEGRALIWISQEEG